jgi:hypothetical protein
MLVSGAVQIWRRLVIFAKLGQRMRPQRAGRGRRQRWTALGVASVTVGSALLLVAMLTLVSLAQLGMAERESDSTGDAPVLKGTTEPTPSPTARAPAKVQPAQQPGGWKRANLPHTLGNALIPSMLGSLNVSATCTASVLYLAHTTTLVHAASGMRGRGRPARTTTEVDPSHRLYQAIQAAHDPATAAVTLVVVTGSDHRMALNWLRHLRDATKVVHVVMICTDDALEHVLRLENLTGVQVVGTMTDTALRDHGALRLHVFTYALCMGANAIMSDVDALWLHDPIPTQLLGAPTDCVFAGSDLPRELAERWRMSSAVNGCLVFCRGNERALSFMTAAAAAAAGSTTRAPLGAMLNAGLERLGLDGDCLRAQPPLPPAVAEAVSEDETAVDPATGARRTVRALRHDRTFSSCTVAPAALSFTMLARHIVAPTCGIAFHGATWPGAVVHCVAPDAETSAEREMLLRAKGLWKLDKQWAD